MFSVHPLTGPNNTWQQKRGLRQKSLETDPVISPRGINGSTQCSALHSCVRRRPISRLRIAPERSQEARDFICRRLEEIRDYRCF
jgi:hypothetical protein